jgi:flagellar biosynthesis protein FlhB
VAENDDKTEDPTAKKLKDSRKKGQIARSRDLAVAAATVAAVIALGRAGRAIVDGLANELTRTLTHFGDHPLQAITASELNGIVITGLITMTMLVAPIAAATIIAGVGTQGAQGGWNFSFEALHFNWGALNPVNGAKKLLSPMQAGLDSLKTMGAVIVIAWLGYGAVRTALTDSARLPWLTPFDAALVGWGYAESLLWRVAVGLAVLAIGDYALQHHRMKTSLRMTKQEVRDEGKQQDGSAETKGRIRRIQRDMARRRMISDVEKATVVITNPTHFAVALESRRGEMSAPRVVAKGADFIAAQIREKARQHGIPLVENKPLAQTLFKTAEVGEAIPAQLFGAVAEVLAQLIRLKQLVL